jgi:hypothetical protein
MIPRSLVATLLALFAVLVVTFAVLMGGYAIVNAFDDATGARILGWLATSCVLLLVVDCLLLLAALAFYHLERSRSETKPLSTEARGPAGSPRE